MLNQAKAQSAKGGQMHLKKLELEYPANTWKMIIFILLIGEKEYQELLVKDLNFIQMCRQSGYSSDYEKVLPSLIKQISEKVNGNNNNLAIELKQPEWEIIYEILALAFETIGEGTLEVNFQSEEISNMKFPDEITIPLDQILLDLEPKIFGIKDNPLILPN